MGICWSRVMGICWCLRQLLLLICMKTVLWWFFLCQLNRMGGVHIHKLTYASIFLMKILLIISLKKVTWKCSEWWTRFGSYKGWVAIGQPSPSKSMLTKLTHPCMFVSHDVNRLVLCNSYFENSPLALPMDGMQTGIIISSCDLLIHLWLSYSEANCGV